MPLMQSNENSAVFLDPETGKEYELTDSYEGEYYDTVYRAAAAITAGLTLRPFSSTTGNDGLPKNKAHTNLSDNKKIPGEHSFILQRISVHLLQAFGSVIAELDDLLGLAYTGHVEFRLGTRLLAEGPLYFFPSGMGLVGQTTESGRSLVNNGVASKGTIPNSIQAHLVTPQKPLNMELRFESNDWATGTAQLPTTTAAVGLMGILHGLITRSIAA